MRLLVTRCFILLIAAGVPAHAATVVPLNDTGQTLCYDSAGTTISCAVATDDGGYGRDAANAAGALPNKIGAGDAGFDFTKIANDGSVLAAGAALGANATDWACTRDNVTGLTWEVKTTDGGLRDWNNTYTWYSTDASNGGNAGTANGGTCTGGINCDTQSYVVAVNATKLCNYTDWRMPSLRELQSLVDFGKFEPAIDSNYFPNTLAVYFLTANNYAPNAGYAWLVSFGGGNTLYEYKSDPTSVRLVRGGQ